jgi:hypothetical protein
MGHVLLPKLDGSATLSVTDGCHGLGGDSAARRFLWVEVQSIRVSQCVRLLVGDKQDGHGRQPLWIPCWPKLILRGLTFFGNMSKTERTRKWLPFQAVSITARNGIYR